MESRPHADSWPALTAALTGCRGCGLWQQASQVVLGTGPQPAALMLVGEQPGNDEDIAGRPFVGPAGRVLHDALRTAAVPVDQIFFTNAVKHFKWISRGPRRMYRRASASEIEVCSHWLGEEARLVSPRLIVCLGATAGQAVVGKHYRVGLHRAKVLQSPLGPAYGVSHPSAILRLPDRLQQARALRELVDDLRQAWEICQGSFEHAPRLDPSNASMAQSPAFL